MLASAGTDVSLWEIGRDEPLQQLQEHGAPVSALRWTSNDRVLGSASHDGSILLIESDGNMFDTLRPVPNEPSVAVPVLSLSWSPGSRYLAAGCNDATVRVFDLQRRVQALQLRGHRAGVGAVAWNPNELHVASASSAGEIVMHRVQGSVAAVSRATHPKLEEDTLPPAVSCLQWAPFEPTKLACAAEDGQVSLWDMEVEAQSSSPSTCFAEHADSCSGLAWSLISHHVLASCSEDSTALLYDTKIGSVVRRFNADVALTALAFAADGVHLAFGTEHGEILLYDLRSSKPSPLWTVEAHNEPVTALAFQRAASGPLKSGARTAIAAGPDGGETATADGVFAAGRQWSLPPASPAATRAASSGPVTPAHHHPTSPALPGTGRATPTIDASRLGAAAATLAAELHATMAASSEPAVTLPASCANSVTYSPAVSTPAATSAVSAVAGTVGRVQSERAAAASAEAKSAAHAAARAKTEAEAAVRAKAEAEASAAAAAKAQQMAAARAKAEARCAGAAPHAAATGAEGCGCGGRGASNAAASAAAAAAERPPAEPAMAAGAVQRAVEQALEGRVQGVVERAVDGALLELRVALQEDIRSLHVEVLREFESSRDELRQLLQQSGAELSRLRDENSRLREENARLHGPLGRAMSSGSNVNGVS